MQLRRAKRLKYVGRKLLRIRIFCPVLPHSIGYYRGIGQCIGGRKSRKFKQTFSRRIKRKVPDFSRNQELFGGDYWTRTSDLLRVKIRLDVKALLLGAFRYFLLHFFRAGKRSLSIVSARWYPDIGQRIGQIPRIHLLGGAGDSFCKRWPCCRDGSLRLRKCQGLFSVQATYYAQPSPHGIVSVHIGQNSAKSATRKEEKISVLSLYHWLCLQIHSG